MAILLSRLGMRPYPMQPPVGHKVIKSECITIVNFHDQTR